MENKSGDLPFMRAIYRALLKSGRTYAAFERDRVLPLVQKLSYRQEILDPMAGYGTLMTYCSELGVSSFSVEYNPPAYLWELLISPANANTFTSMANNILEPPNVLLNTSEAFAVSANWFPDISKRILIDLFCLCRTAAENVSANNAGELALAFILPFVGRFSTFVPGNVVTHVKKGGICIYKGWQLDFNNYINAIKFMIYDNISASTIHEHHIVYGDCRTMLLPKARFPAMITSPPFPNGRDYSSMFAPENDFIIFLASQGLISAFDFNRRLIGTVYVSRSKKSNSCCDVRSTSARRFLSRLEAFKGTKQAQYDNKVYYIPYYKYYFSGLEQAFANIAKALQDDFEGYIIVVNNTARNMIIPVSDAVVEAWHDLGFDASVDDELTREMAHLGSINPRVKGLKARHTEYTIKVSRK